VSGHVGVCGVNLVMGVRVDRGETEKKGDSVGTLDRDVPQAPRLSLSFITAYVIP